MKKKISLIAVSVCLAASLGACSSGAENVNEESDTAAVQEISEATSDNTTAAPEQIDAIALMTEMAHQENLMKRQSNS